MVSPVLVTDRIRRSLSELTPAERKIAKVLLDASPSVGLDSSTRLAALAGVSGATVIRFVNRLGFDRYSGFRQALHDELRERVAGPLDLYPRGRQTSELAEQTRHLIESATVALEETFSSLQPGDVDQVVALLSNDANRLVIMGGWFSHALARHLANLLAEVRAGVTFVEASPRQMATALADCDARTVCLIFDFRRFERDLEYFGRQAARRRSKIVLLTDQWLSPLVDTAQVTFTAYAGRPEPFESYVGLVALIEFLVTRVIDGRLDDARTRTATLEAVAGGLESDTRSVHQVQRSDRAADERSRVRKGSR